MYFYLYANEFEYNVIEMTRNLEVIYFILFDI
jgi:hypothetical protein